MEHGKIHDDLFLLWNTVNSPMKAGHKWCQYSRESIDNVLPALKRVMMLHDIKFKGDL